MVLNLSQLSLGLKLLFLRSIPRPSLWSRQSPLQKMPFRVLNRLSPLSRNHLIVNPLKLISRLLRNPRKDLSGLRLLLCLLSLLPLLLRLSRLLPNLINLLGLPPLLPHLRLLLNVLKLLGLRTSLHNLLSLLGLLILPSLLNLLSLLGLLTLPSHLNLLIHNKVESLSHRPPNNLSLLITLRLHFNQLSLLISTHYWRPPTFRISTPTFAILASSTVPTTCLCCAM